MEISIDIKDNVDAAGEELRNTFFVGEGLGCYSNFNVTENADKLDKDQLTPSFLFTPEMIKYFNDYNIDVNIFKTMVELTYGTYVDVVMIYWWDGDGTLIFLLDDGHENICIWNDDCKKTYGWHMSDYFKEAI